MRRRSDTDIWEALPVAAVMARAAFRLGKITDFIMLITSIFQSVDEQLEHLSAGIIVQRANFSLLQHVVQRGIRFIHEAVCGNMLYLELQRMA